MARLLLLISLATLAAAQQQCPPGFSSPPIYSGVCYRSITTANAAGWSWGTARSACVAAGGDFAVLTSDTDYSNLLGSGCGGTNPSKVPQWFGLYNWKHPNCACSAEPGSPDCSQGWLCWSIDQYTQVGGASIAWIKAHPGVW